MSATRPKKLRRFGDTDAVVQLRSDLTDAALLGLYWMGAGLTSSGGLVSQWDDARGASGFGPSFTASGTARPTLAASGVVVFDGVANVMVTAGAALAGITGDCGLALIGVLPTVTATEQRLCEIGDAAGGGTRLLALIESATTDLLTGGVAAGAAPSGAVTATYPGRRVAHARRTATNGTTVTAGLQVGAVAEVTQAGLAATPQTAGQVGLGGSRTGSGQFTACSVVALVLYKGDYAGKQVLVNRFALSLGALL